MKPATTGARFAFSTRRSLGMQLSKHAAGNRYYRALCLRGASSVMINALLKTQQSRRILFRHAIEVLIAEASHPKRRDEFGETLRRERIALLA
jgi:hypothetical protein